MIAFDNGPANGDYVRYIDELTRRAAIVASAGILTDDVGGATLARVRERLAAEAGRLSPQTPAGGRTPGGNAMVESSQATGFAQPTVATPAATAAAAIASALMSGQMGDRMALPTHVKFGLAVIAGGIALVVAGLVVEPLNFVPMAVGGALIAWAVRMMRDASTRSSSTRA